VSDSSAYDRWVAAGEPFILAKPLATLRDLLRGYGYTVYDKGDDRHLHADPPEDHTPYSATGWPATSPFGWGFAIDIMPPTKAGLPSLAQLGAQLVADRKAGLAGVAWLKYINWEPGDGSCYHDSWQPTFARRDSSDRGHIHLSGRTDYQTSTAAVGYDPVARVRSTGMTELTSAQAKALANLANYEDPRIEAFARGYDKIRFGGDKDQEMFPVMSLKRIESALKALPAPATAAEIVSALVADPAFIAAVRMPSAAELVAEMIRQFGTPTT
jgi:hypothetical protein